MTVYQMHERKLYGDTAVIFVPRDARTSMFKFRFSLYHRNCLIESFACMFDLLYVYRFLPSLDAFYS